MRPASEVRTDGWRTGLAVALATLFVVWPIVHIVLTRTTGLSSWKLAGWGMYASINPFSVGLTVLALPEGESLRGVELGPVLGLPRLLGVSRGTTGEIEVPEERRHELGKLFQYLQVFRSDREMEELAKLLTEVSPERPSAVLIMFSVPRLDIHRRHTYTETEVHLVVPGRGAKDLGTFNSEQLSEREILQRVEKQMATELAAGGGGVGSPAVM